MPRDMIMYRFHYEETGQTGEWKQLFHALSSSDKNELIDIVSLTLTEIKQMEYPEKFKDILPYYFLKYVKEDDSVEDNNDC